MTMCACLCLSASVFAWLHLYDHVFEKRQHNHVFCDHDNVNAYTWSSVRVLIYVSSSADLCLRAFVCMLSPAWPCRRAFAMLPSPACLCMDISIYLRLWLHLRDHDNVNEYTWIHLPVCIPFFMCLHLRGRVCVLSPCCLHLSACFHLRAFASVHSSAGLHLHLRHNIVPTSMWPHLHDHVYEKSINATCQRGHICITTSTSSRLRDLVYMTMPTKNFKITMSTRPCLHDHACLIASIWPHLWKTST